jgi:hypothetical protein
MSSLIFLNKLVVLRLPEKLRLSSVCLQNGGFAFKVEVVFQFSSNFAPISSSFTEKRWGRKLAQRVGVGWVGLWLAGVVVSNENKPNSSFKAKIDLKLGLSLAKIIFNLDSSNHK